MPRRKPRFTVDPPPLDTTGAGLLNWAYTQLQRIEDWWPKDYGDRVSALEELQGELSGEWTVSGASSIRFEGAISETAVFPAYMLFSLDSSTLSETDYSGFGSLDGDVFSNAVQVVSNLSGTMVLMGNNDLFKSVDGETWEECTDTGMNTSLYQEAIFVGSRWLCVGVPSGSAVGYRVSESSDLETWSEIESSTGIISFAQTNLGIATDGNGNVAFPLYDSSFTKSYIRYSTDNGSTWANTSEIASASNVRLSRVAYSGGIWWGLGYGKSLYKSNNLTSWSSVFTLQGNATTSLIGIAYDGSRWLIIENDASAPRLLESTDGSSFSVQQSSWLNCGSANGLYWDEDNAWICVSGGNMKVSSDGQNWSDLSNTYTALRGITKIYRGEDNTP